MISVETSTRVDTTVTVRDNLVGLLLEQDRDIPVGAYIAGPKLLELLMALRVTVDGHAWKVIDEIMGALYEACPSNIRDGVNWQVWITVEPVMEAGYAVEVECTVCGAQRQVDAFTYELQGEAYCGPCECVQNMDKLLQGTHAE